jgi:hypothetical protein
MSTLPIPSLRHPRALAVLALALAAIIAATATSASAAPATGEVVLTLKSGAQSSLLREGVKASPRSDKGKAQTVKLAVAGLELSGAPVIDTGATLTFGADGKSVKLKDVALKAAASSTAISARQGGKKKVFFRVKGAASIDGLSVRLSGPLALTVTGAKALRQALGLDGIRAGKVGTATARAVVAVPAPEPVKPAAPEPPKPSAYPYSDQCPIAPVAGNPGFGKAPGQVSGIAPGPPFGAEAREVTGTALDWGFKASFRSYVLNVDKKPGDSLITLDGVTASAANMAAASAFFDFPVATGTYEAGTSDPGDDRLVADGTGTVVFCKTGHGFSVVLKNPTLTIDGEDSRITADVGANMNGEWYPLQRADIADLDLTGIEPEVSGSEVAWEDIPVKLSADGALATGLYDANTPLDNITVEATLGPEPPEPYPYETQCAVPAVPGGPGFGDPPGTIDGIAAAPTFNSGTSQPVTGTELDWGFKQSFRSYVLAVPPAGTLQPLDGASASAAGLGMVAADAYFGFPTAAGTYEPGTEPDHSDDKLVVDGTGTVLFCKPGHGFNVVLKNPTVTIDGENSRITADVGANYNGVWYPFQRTDIAELDLSAVAPKFTAGGNTVVWDDIPATLTEDGEIATGGIYAEGDALDPITVKTSLDRPLLTQCALAAGTVPTPPAVDFTLAPLPTLASPVVRSGENLGTINWGFRRSTRSTTVSGADPAANAFQLLGGATESFPGNMGGSANAYPPTASAGLGKFFRFPVSSYSYEAGTSDPGDDRLIATSDATVGFCNVKFGGFALVISKPTLVIDGGESRLIANAYSYAGPFGAGAAKGWIGGRVDVVELNTSAVDAVAGSGAVSWGEINGDNDPLENGIPIEFGTSPDVGLRTEAFSIASLTEASTKEDATKVGGGFDPVAAQIVLPAP